MRQHPFEVRKVNDTLTATLHLMMDGCTAFYAEYFDQLNKDNWRIYVVDQTRGRCYWSYKVITIPSFVFKRERQYKAVGYTLYYLCHEMAHAKAGPLANHGPDFMKAFKMLCPREFWHYESEYKPKYALGAGIVPEDF